MKKISILGSTGSIGTMTLDVVRHFPNDFKVIALAANRSVQLISEQINEFYPKIVSVGSEQNVKELAKLIDTSKTTIFFGNEGLKQVATLDETDTVISALSGAAGLRPTLDAVNAGKNIALANKETLVMGGKLLTKLAQKKSCKIIPIDSEHSALFQCLLGNRREDVTSLILTASGGPFRELDKHKFSSITPKQALSHPVWKMGAKVTIDSATLMNKGLEVIEARWLFNFSPENIEVVVHPQSIIHSMVRYNDGTIISNLSQPNMRIPILYSLTYPERWKSIVPHLDLYKTQLLELFKPDTERFPCLNLAFQALQQSDSAPIILNRADEVSVEAFLRNEILFTDIPRVIEASLDKFQHQSVNTFEDIFEIDKLAYEVALDIVRNIKKKKYYVNT